MRLCDLRFLRRSYRPALALVLLAACNGPTHPTGVECKSREDAARYYYKVISGNDTDGSSFRSEEFGEGYSGFRIYDPAGRSGGALVINDADCSLILFDNFAFE